MATFTYRYRDPSGSVRSETVEAADRAGAFKALKVRGIMPLSVVDGGRPAGARRPPLRWLAAAACVLVCAVAGVFAILHGGRRGGASAREADAAAREADAEPPRREAPPAASPKAGEPARKPPEATPPAVAGPVGPPMSNGVAAAVEPAATNRVFRAPSLGRRKVTLMDGTAAELSSRRIFGRDKPLDLQIMAVTKPGGMAGGLRALLVRYSDEEIVSMLREPVVYDPEDPEDVRLIKARVQTQKSIVLDYLAQGGTVQDAFEQMCKAAGRERIEMRNDQIELNRLVQGGDAEAVRRFLGETNARRRESGLPELPLPNEYRLQMEEQDK